MLGASAGVSSSLAKHATVFWMVEVWVGDWMSRVASAKKPETGFDYARWVGVWIPWLARMGTMPATLCCVALCEQLLGWRLGRDGKEGYWCRE